MRIATLSLISFVLLVGCGRREPGSADVAPKAASSASPASAPPASATVRSARGVVRKIDPAEGYVKIRHEDIPGFMRAMTMPFAFSDRSVVEGFAEGDAVDFTFFEDADHRLRLVSIRKQAAAPSPS